MFKGELLLKKIDQNAVDFQIKHVYIRCSHLLVANFAFLLIACSVYADVYPLTWHISLRGHKMTMLCNNKFNVGGCLLNESIVVYRHIKT